MAGAPSGDSGINSAALGPSDSPEMEHLTPRLNRKENDCSLTGSGLWLIRFGVLMSSRKCASRSVRYHSGNNGFLFFSLFEGLQFTHEAQRVAPYFSWGSSLGISFLLVFF